MENSIEIKNLSKYYRKTPALQNLSLTLTSGKIIGLLGPNGCGKTTLLKILAGLTSDYEGHVEILGQAIGVETKARVSFLPEKSALDENNYVHESISLYAAFFPDFSRTKAEKMLQHFQIAPHKRIRELSKGTQEKLQIALSMSRQAKIYLLDEPISGVDPAARAVILEGILNNFSDDSVLLVSTHLIADVESILDEVIFMNSGRILLHQAAETLRQQKNKSVDQYFREVFSCLAS